MTLAAIESPVSQAPLPICLRKLPAQRGMGGFVVYTKDNNVAAVAGVGLVFVAAAPPAVQTRRSYCVRQPEKAFASTHLPAVIGRRRFPVAEALHGRDGLVQSTPSQRGRKFGRVERTHTTAKPSGQRA